MARVQIVVDEGFLSDREIKAVVIAVRDLVAKRLSERVDDTSGGRLIEGVLPRDEVEVYVSHPGKFDVRKPRLTIDIFTEHTPYREAHLRYLIGLIGEDLRLLPMLPFLGEEDGLVELHLTHSKMVKFKKQPEKLA